MEKRLRERVRRQKQQDKQRRRDERAAQRRTDLEHKPAGKDSDLEGIVAGPQPGQIIV